MPLLAGLARIAARPEQWIEPLMSVAAKPTHRRIRDCLSRLSVEVGSGKGAFGHGVATEIRSQITGSTTQRPSPFST
jgi:hypothetical protein